MRKPWSRVSLHRHLLKLLERPTTTVAAGTLRKPVAARVNFDDSFPPDRIKVEIDANNMSATQLVVHELLHVVCSELVLGKFDETLEEVLILALEAHMMDHINKSKTRRTRWADAIERKLAESLATLPAVPLSVQTERP